MPRYVAFLRGINLGRRRIKMDVLRERFVEQGFAEVATFIASGNVLFDSPARDAAKLAARIAAHLEKTLGYDVDTFLRTRTEVATVAASAPFPAADMAAAHSVHAIFLHEPLDAATARALEAVQSDHDALRVAGREIYWLCRIPTPESDIWSSPAVRALKLPKRTTARNLNMLRRLAAEFPAAEEK